MSTFSLSRVRLSTQPPSTQAAPVHLLIHAASRQLTSHLSIPVRRKIYLDPSELGVQSPEAAILPSSLRGEEAKDDSVNAASR